MKNRDKLVAPRLTALAWATIVAQVTFPMAVAFTPAIAAVKQQTVSNADENSLENRFAQIANQAGGLLSSDNVGDAALGQLRGLAVGEANQQVQDWLQRFGNARVQLNVDDRGRLEGSQFDMLVPLYDVAEQMAFSQFGLRHIDHRTTGNVGIGQRHFIDDWMLGYNTFLDHDITQDHTRLGIGAEYGQDYLKVGANGYFRLSGWRDADIDNHQARPANGFDIRGEGYLPDYPQVGGKLTYEQYFGDEVGLFGKEHRQKDPGAFTAGINYTPVPLFTVGVDRKQGTSGHGETLFNAGLNYQLGTPWETQLDPDAVAFRRTLQGSRYDLVERNNQIVLEYQRKDLIRLAAESMITGLTGEEKPLNARVTSQYGLQNINWEAASLIANGGAINDNGGQYSVTLPAYQPNGTNSYTISGIAYDTKGNASNRVDTQVTVLGDGVPSPENSTFNAENAVLPQMVLAPPPSP